MVLTGYNYLDVSLPVLTKNLGQVTAPPAVPYLNQDSQNQVGSKWSKVSGGIGVNRGSDLAVLFQRKFSYIHALQTTRGKKTNNAICLNACFCNLEDGANIHPGRVKVS